MFQTEINLALQSIGSAPVTWLLTGVTLLGYLPAYVVALLALVFGVRLRPGMALVGALLLTGLATDTAKNAVAYPRPDEVDPRVARTAAALPLPLEGPGGGRSFWEPPRPEAIAAVRARASGNYGFPSGHVAAATAFLLTAAWLFRSRRLVAFAVAWVPLMAVSRLYLGRHFLADVCGGLAIGLVATGASILLFRPLAGDRPGWPGARALRPLRAAAFALVAAVPFAPVLNPRYVGGLVGLSLALAAIGRAGPPPDGGTRGQKAGRVLLGVALCAAAFFGAEGLFLSVGASAASAAVVSGAATTLAALAGTVSAARRLGLYAPRP